MVGREAYCRIMRTAHQGWNAMSRRCPDLACSDLMSLDAVVVVAGEAKLGEPLWTSAIFLAPLCSYRPRALGARVLFLFSWCRLESGACSLHLLLGSSIMEVKERARSYAGGEGSYQREGGASAARPGRAQRALEDGQSAVSVLPKSYSPLCDRRRLAW
ncbi:BQ2448_1905 [Microbotryum intermedium]|uniref:BQ2448_1905 protein n=1 Tax=Microbotryum intermedium TaxID=269621 RepID=A0A238FEI4_9BASI|nr:BQ2448_1905 [Microbotryum intermedium]